MDSFIEFLLFKIVIPFSVIFVIALIIALPISIYYDSKEPKFFLEKKDWICMQEHTYLATTMVPSGRIMIPIVTTHKDCIQWNKK